MGSADRDRGEYLWGALVPQPARPAGEERPGPGHKIRIGPFGSQYAAEGCGVDIVEAPLYVEKERGDLPLSHLEGPHFVGDGGYRVCGRKACLRAALVSVEEARHSGHTGGSGVHYPLKDLGESLEQYDNPEGRGGVVRGLTQFVADNAIGTLEGEGVGTVCHQGARRLEIR